MTREPNEFDNEIKVIEVDSQDDAVSEDKSQPQKESETKKDSGLKHGAEVNVKKYPEVTREIEPQPDKAAMEDTTTTNMEERDYDDFIFTRYHGKRKKRFTGSENHNNSSYSYKNHFVKEVSSRRKRKKPWWKKLLIILAIILAALILLSAIGVGAFFILKESGLSQLTDNDVSMTAPVIENAGVSVDNSKNTITYNGVTYAYKNDMTSILCMGIDKKGDDGLGLRDDIVGTGGQADALYLVALNTKTGETDVIGISRDIYSDISVYATDGQYAGVERAQLCLAYAYGDGREKSCDNTVNAVKRLFYNLPINSYFAMDLTAIGDLNDAVGGVEVTIPDNYIHHATGYDWYAGDVVTLRGIEAKWFLQYRDVNELNSSVDRMNRQLTYLEKFAQNAISMTKKDLTTPVTLFNIVKDYSVTNLNASKISALGYTVATSGAEVEFRSVPGEVIHNGEYAEFVVDEQGMLELILDVYYEPVR